MKRKARWLAFAMLAATFVLAAACAKASPAPIPENSVEVLDAATTRGGFTLSYPQAGAHGWAFGAYPYDIGAVGYVEEEFFIEGVAQRYQPIGELTKDGEWTLQPVSAAPYKTRFIVRRPANPADFNGIVVLEWTNVSGGFEMSMMDSSGLYEEGFAYVSASVQMNGLYGFPEAAGGLTTWDAERYGSLHMADDGQSYDIFTQIARAVGKDRTTQLDPMGGLVVKKVIAVGASQSGSRVLSYANGVQPIERTFDAIVPAICAGRGTDFASQSAHEKKNGKTTTRTVPARVREDINCKVFILNTQTEASALGGLAQPNTPNIVSWQIAGASHLPPERMVAIAAQCLRDGLTGYGANEETKLAPTDWTLPYEAALVGIIDWIDSGIALPHTEPLASINMIFGYKMDGKGNAKGGVRLPEMSVPLATYDISLTTGFSGKISAFSQSEIMALYPTHEAYIADVTEAAHAAVAQGILLPHRVREYTEKAGADWVATLWTDTPAIALTGAGNGFNTVMFICISACVLFVALIALVVVVIARKVRRRRARTKA